MTSVYAKDVVIGTQNTVTFGCTMPTAYSNDSPIIAADTLTVSIYSSLTQGGPYTKINTTTTQCPFVIDVSSFTEGSYYYVLTAHSSIYNMDSAYSNEGVINMIAPLAPNAPVLLEQ